MTTDSRISLFLLASGLIFAPAAWAQTCNSSIPLSTPGNEFTDNGDGTVTHHRTGLTWKTCVEGLSGSNCSNGTVTAMNWQDALQYADAHIFAGYADWRLPNIKELASIVEYSCYQPAVNTGLFPNMPPQGVWSSTPDAEYSSSTWTSGFYLPGTISSSDRNSTLLLLLVRD